MFSFFKKNTKLDYAVLETDIHSHLIPGIDDGAKNMADSLNMIREMSEMGYQKIITTPHVMEEYFPNTRERILDGLAEVQNEVKKANIPIEITAAAEYFLDGNFADLLKNDEPLLTLWDNRVLIEFSTLVPPNNLFDSIFKLKTKGYQPILAHPERYIYYGKEFEIFQKIKSKGCELQVNLLSIAGHYGSTQKKLAMKLLKANLVDFLGTDCHRMSHLEKLKGALKSREMQRFLREVGTGF